jgi:deoxycytidylate deaminase
MEENFENSLTVSKEYGSLEGVLRAYQEHQDLLIIALTGRTGSGCSTAADLLSHDFDNDLFEGFQPTEPEVKKYKIIKEFCDKNWEKFTKITVSSLLLTFLQDESWVDIKDLNGRLDADHRLDDAAMSSLEEALSKTRANIRPIQDALGMTRHQIAATDWTKQTSLKRAISIELPRALAILQEALGSKYNTFLQEIGDNLRKSGSAVKRELDSTKLFSLPHRIVKAIEIVREIDKSTGVKTRIVIDAIRNPLELIFLRDRYSPLYAAAITSDEKDRKSRLTQRNYSAADIALIDNREYPKKHDQLSSYKSLVTQDIQSCLQKADLFVANPGQSTESVSARRTSTSQMYAQICRYIALALKPGLVTPTRDERCMQVAFIAKANSGCISRQVGAAVTDEGYAVKAIGWNDVPKGQTPCSLRNVDEFIAATDHNAYSTFEREDDRLREFIASKNVARGNLAKDGLPCSFCFKDAVNQSVFEGKSNQVHTRSLHAEENAFLQLTTGGVGIKGGKLYTTASPCELCSKKAYQLGISDVIYIDPYPGISIQHVLSSGDPQARPKLRLFSGAVGKAYHRVYEPMLPVKDEIRARLSV